MRQTLLVESLEGAPLRIELPTPAGGDRAVHCTLAAMAEIARHDSAEIVRDNGRPTTARGVYVALQRCTFHPDEPLEERIERPAALWPMIRGGRTPRVDCDAGATLGVALLLAAGFHHPALVAVSKASDGERGPFKHVAAAVFHQRPTPAQRWPFEMRGRPGFLTLLDAQERIVPGDWYPNVGRVLVFPVFAG